MNKVKGDLIEMAVKGDFDVIVHGCNCWNTMGSGIARQIREQLPDAWLADQETVEGDRHKLGTYTIGLHDKLIIVNAYTQYRYNRGDPLGHKDLFEYTSFETILNKLAKRFGCFKFGFPMIGMGLAGGDSAKILAMLETFSQKVSESGGSVTLVEYQG